MSYLAKFESARLVYADLSGLRIEVVEREGVIVAVTVDSVIEAVPELEESPHWIAIKARSEYVMCLLPDEGRAECQCIALREFYRIVIRSNSPRLVRFHEQLAEFATEFQQKGYVVDRSRHPSGVAGLPDEQSDPVEAYMQRMLEVYRDQKAIKARQDELEIKVGKVANMIGAGPSSWTVAAWVSHHGRKLSDDQIRNEGLLCRGIYDRLGYPPPRNRDKVPNGNGPFSARKWPRAVIQVWWPECCKRYGWDVTWDA